MDYTKSESVSSGCVSVKPLVVNHITNNNVVVDVFQTDYSDCFRSYRVCRRDPLGQHTPAFLRILSVNDMMLVAVLFALAVPSLPPFVDRLRAVNWMPLSSMNMDDTISISDSRSGWIRGGSSSNVFSVYHWAPELPLTRIILLLLCCVVTICRLVTGLQRAQTEEVMAIRGLGIQVTSYNVFGWIVSQRFVEHKLIRSLVVHDGFFRCQAIFFLSATIENEAALLVFFEETLPRLAVLRPVLCGLRYILYEEPENGATLTEMEEKELDRLDDSVDSELKDTEEDTQVSWR